MSLLPHRFAAAFIGTAFPLLFFGCDAGGGLVCGEGTREIDGMCVGGDLDGGIVDAAADGRTSDTSVGLEDVVALVPQSTSTQVNRWLATCVRVQLLFADGTERRAAPGEVSAEHSTEVGPAPFIPDCEGVAVQGLAEGSFTVPIAAGAARAAFGLEVLPADGVDVECRATPGEGAPDFSDGVGSPLLVHARALGRGTADPAAMRVRFDPPGAASSSPARVENDPSVFGAVRVEAAGDYTIVCEWTFDGEVLGTGEQRRVAVPARGSFSGRPGITLTAEFVQAGDSWYEREIDATECVALETLVTECGVGASGRFVCERHLAPAFDVERVAGGSAVRDGFCAGSGGEVSVRGTRGVLAAEGTFWISGSAVESISGEATGAIVPLFDELRVPIALWATVAERTYEIERSPLLAMGADQRRAQVLVDGEDWTVSIPGHPGWQLSIYLNGPESPFYGDLGLGVSTLEGIEVDELTALARQLAGAELRFPLRYPTHLPRGDEVLVSLTLP